MNQTTKLNANSGANPDSGVSSGFDSSKIEAAIGASVKINGDISGNEDLLINGTVEGTIDFRENNVVIGKNGNVHANVVAKNICVEGEIKGELRGGEQITIMPSGRVVGDIRAPRVILSDGCQFKGSVDMEEKPSMSNDPRSAAAKLSSTKPLGEKDGIIPRKL